MRRSRAERRREASLAGEVKVDQILEGGLRAFQVWKEVRKGVSFPHREN